MFEWIVLAVMCFDGNTGYDSNGVHLWTAKCAGGCAPECVQVATRHKEKPKIKPGEILLRAEVIIDENGKTK